MSRYEVLILSADVLAAALIGAAVELAGHQPCFPEWEEAAREALRRVRPHVVLVDCDHEHACDDAFVGPALMTGARVLLFDSGRNGHRGREMADRLGLHVVRLPEDHDVLLYRLRNLID